MIYEPCRFIYYFKIKGTVCDLYNSILGYWRRRRDALRYHNVHKAKRTCIPAEWNVDCARRLYISERICICTVTCDNSPLLNKLIDLTMHFDVTKLNVTPPPPTPPTQRNLDLSNKGCHLSHDFPLSTYLTRRLPPDKRWHRGLTADRGCYLIRVDTW